MNNRTLDIGRALTFMFEEDEWVMKFLIGVGLVLFSWLILPGLILQGYSIEIIRRVGRGQTPALPEWDAWGKYLSDGLIAAVAALVYALPAVLFACCPLLLIGAASDSSSSGMEGAFTLLICCLFILIALIELPLFLIFYGAGLIRYAERGGLRSFFEFGALWRYVRATGSQYAYAVVVSFIAGIVGGFVPILGQVWYQFAFGHAFGQLLAMTSGPDANEMPLGESF